MATLEIEILSLVSLISQVFFFMLGAVFKNERGPVLHFKDKWCLSSA